MWVAFEATRRNDMNVNGARALTVLVGMGFLSGGATLPGSLPGEYLS